MTLFTAAGLGPTDISRIVDRTPKDVTSVIAKIRAKKKGDKKLHRRG